ncbi:MAG TPA: lipase maturation factor family protein, partial [Kofleriaceae bacterium]|nr:lipase maturation factor family protein [Kofleriaceae bacterium]
AAANAAAAAPADDVPDLRPRTPLDALAARLGPPRRYQLTRWLVLRLLGFIYVFAFLGLILQGPGLLGSHGLTPIAAYLHRLRGNGLDFWDAPSLFWGDASDGAIAAWAWVGLALSIVVLLGYANAPILLALWAIYASFVHLGQTWFSFGWEIQILETTLLAAALAHPWDPRPLRAPSPPPAAIVLMRWLAFRIMLGAGLIKLRGDACWTHLTCLDAHFETQPIPNPLSPFFHHAPHWVHAAGVLFNHVVEVGLPWFVFGPRRLRRVAAVGMAAFQVVLILSGNLAFLNWLTLVPVLACLDDDFLLRLVPRRPRAWLEARLAAPPARDLRQLLLAFAAGAVVAITFALASFDADLVLFVLLVPAAIVGAHAARAHVASPGRRLDGHLLAVGLLAGIVAVRSVDVVENLASHHQAMNRSYDRFDLVNTYGAFGSVGTVRHELVLEGTQDADPDHATWHAYELPCKPGPLDRRPCVLGPYHRRLDWLIWFAAMDPQPADPWLIHLVYGLLDGNRAMRTLLAVDPFHGEKPTFIRIRRFVYHLAPPGAPTWWTRDHEELWLPPISLANRGLRPFLARYGWETAP